MKNKTLVIFCLFQFFVLCVYGQNHLKTEDVFDKYQKKQGSLFVQLGKDVLSQGSKISLYKSLIIDEDPTVLADIRKAMESDTSQKLAITEVRSNGVLQSGSYFIGTNNNENEYLLYKYKNKKITLVYLKGDFNSRNLDNELKKLKDLFIYINNKKIKIQ